MKNSGNMAGWETVLWFIKDHVGSITRPVKELKYFEKIYLEPGQSKTVSFTVDPNQHLVYPDFSDLPILENGKFTVSVGGKSASFNYYQSDITEVRKND